MSNSVPRGAVLKAGKAGAKGEAIRRQTNKRNLLTAIVVALLSHLLIILGFMLIDLLGFRDITEWSGPVLVKIGAPDAQESKKPDPGILPEQPDTPQTETPVLPETPLEPPVDNIEPETAASTPESNPDASTDASRPETPSESATTGSSEPVESPFAEPKSQTSSQPARVQGSEDGNNYLLDIDGMKDDVGRTHQKDYVIYYMPLPQLLEPGLFAGLVEFANVKTEENPAYYWEIDPLDDMYVTNGSFVPYHVRPFFWSRLIELGYDTDQAEWREFASGEIVVEFQVVSSPGGAYLENIQIKPGTGTMSPEVNDSIKFGLSQWGYYNTTDHPINGRLTYRFKR